MEWARECFGGKHGKPRKSLITRCGMPKHAALVRLTWRLRKVSLSQGFGLGFISEARGSLMPDPWEVRRGGRACTEFTSEVDGAINMAEARIIWPPGKPKVANQSHTVRDLIECGEL